MTTTTPAETDVPSTSGRSAGELLAAAGERWRREEFSELRSHRVALRAGGVAATVSLGSAAGAVLRGLPGSQVLLVTRRAFFFSGAWSLYYQVTRRVRGCAHEGMHARLRLSLPVSPILSPLSNPLREWISAQRGVDDLLGSVVAGATAGVAAGAGYTRTPLGAAVMAAQFATAAAIGRVVGDAAGVGDALIDALISARWLEDPPHRVRRRAAAAEAGRRARAARLSASTSTSSETVDPHQKDPAATPSVPLWWQRLPGARVLTRDEAASLQRRGRAHVVRALSDPHALASHDRSAGTPEAPRGAGSSPLGGGIGTSYSNEQRAPRETGPEGTSEDLESTMGFAARLWAKRPDPTDLNRNLPAAPVVGGGGENYSTDYGAPWSRPPGGGAAA